MNQNHYLEVFETERAVASCEEVTEEELAVEGAAGDQMAQVAALVERLVSGPLVEAAGVEAPSECS